MNTNRDEQMIRAADPDSLWQCEDPIWMAARTQEWKKIQKRLAGATEHVPRNYWKHLKAYFFYGVELPETNGRPMNVYREICRWWMCPSPDDLTIFKCRTNADAARREFSYLYNDLRSPIKQEGDAVYGVMGGREQLIKLALNPCLDGEKKIDIPNGLTGKCCADGSSIVLTCLTTTNNEIGNNLKQQPKSRTRLDYPYVAYHPTLVMWDHVSRAMEKEEWIFYCVKDPGIDGRANFKLVFPATDRKKRIDRLFNSTLKRVLTFFDRDEDNLSRQRPLTVAHVEYLLNRYESKDFSDPLLERWDRAKGLIKPGRRY